MFKKKKAAGKLKKRFTELSDLPEELVTNYSRMVLLGDKEFLIVNYSGIIEIEKFLNKNDSFYNYSLKTKKRYIDPLVVSDRLCDIDDECFGLKDEFLNMRTDGYVTNKRIRK